MFAIRQATKEDASLLHQLVRELADYENLAHEVKSTSEDFAKNLFGEIPQAFTLLAFSDDGSPAGFALWYRTYSTFLGQPGAFLEDLYVRQIFRRQGAGHALFDAVVRMATDTSCHRLEWRALRWNTPSLAFYRSIGAETLPDWVTHRIAL